MLRSVRVQFSVPSTMLIKIQEEGKQLTLKVDKIKYKVRSVRADDDTRMPTQFLAQSDWFEEREGSIESYVESLKKNNVNCWVLYPDGTTVNC